MKQFQLLLFSVIILFVASELHAQDIHLTSGNKTKTIKAGTFIMLELPVSNQEPCRDCPLNTLTGQLVSFADSIIKLKVSSSFEPLVLDGKNVGYTHKSYESKTTQLTLDIPQDLILSITRKGTKKARDMATGDVLAISLFLLGSAHLVSAPIAELTEDNSGSTLLWVGLSEIIAGIVLGGISRQMTYITSENCPQKTEREKVWILRE